MSHYYRVAMLRDEAIAYEIAYLAGLWLRVPGLIPSLGNNLVFHNALGSRL